jgi:hypothetical protein
VRRRNSALLADFSIQKADRSTCVVVVILCAIFSTVLVAYGQRIQVVPMRDTFEHGDNSHIWFRDMPNVYERNNSESAQHRLPSLYVAMEKLRLTHFQEISHVPPRDVGEYEKGLWARKEEIDDIWLRLFDDVASIQHVCHLRLGAGYTLLIYLEALPDAEITVYDTCDGDQKDVCDTVEKFVRSNYPSRNVTLRRTGTPIATLISETNGECSGESCACTRFDGEICAQGGWCDWLTLDFISSSTTPMDTLQSLSNSTACPNILCERVDGCVFGDEAIAPVANNVGVETEDDSLSSAARAWEQGVQSRVALQHRCRPCYGNSDDQCTYCFGEMLCGGVLAEGLQELVKRKN